MAAIGRRTTLVSTDAASGGASGLTDYLSGKADADAVVNTETVPGVSYVGHGTVAEDRADILAGAEAPQALATLTAGSDIVFITAAPADKSADAATIARWGMQTLVLVRRGRTTAPQLTRAISALTEAGGEVAGLVWTKSAQ
jgi:Mrp family chromosome partitioning ATPase